MNCFSKVLFIEVGDDCHTFFQGFFSIGADHYLCLFFVAGERAFFERCDEKIFVEAVGKPLKEQRFTIFCCGLIKRLHFNCNRGMTLGCQ